jgi:hypothetical protein
MYECRKYLISSKYFFEHTFVVKVRQNDLFKYMKYAILYASVFEIPIEQVAMTLVFVLSILWCNQSDHDLQEDLAKFGYRLNMKIIF